MARVLDGGPPEHLLNGYGPTETTTFALTHEIKDVPERARSVPIGRPIGNTRVYILDRLGWLVPAAVVRLDAFPLTPSGKLDRRALPAGRRPAGDTVLTRSGDVKSSMHSPTAL